MLLSWIGGSGGRRPRAPLRVRSVGGRRAMGLSERARPLRRRSSFRYASPCLPKPSRLDRAGARTRARRRCAFRASRGSLSDSRRVPFGVKASKREEFRELATSFVDAPGDRPLGSTEDGRGLFVGAPLDADENQSGAQRLTQLVDALTQGAIELRARRVTRRVAAGGIMFVGQDFGHARIVRALRDPRASPRADAIQREVYGNPIKPRIGLAPPVEAREG